MPLKPSTKCSGGRGRSPKSPACARLPRTFRVERNRYIPRATLEESVREQFNKLRNNGERARLVTLHGFGGMGKTRLAISVALKSVGSFKDGVYFISLDECLPSAQSVVEAIGAALELEGNSLTRDTLFAFLENRQTLLVLDNYESVHCEKVQDFLRDLLNATNHLRLLVTGRESVRIGDIEQRIEVAGLTDEQAIDLFIARAQLLRPDWQPTTKNEHTALREILTLTECIPLALELTAAHCKQKTVRQIANSLSNTPLPTLPKGYKLSDPSPRHQSLERCLNWSYKFLKRAEKNTLARISLFADTFSAETVQQACDLEQAEDLLNELLEAALLIDSELDGTIRYSLLRPTRAYARQKFELLPHAAELRQRYIAFYVQLVQDNHDINDHAKNAVFEREWRNARAAGVFAKEKYDWQSLDDLSGGLDAFLDLRSLCSEREQLNKDSLNTARYAGQRGAEGRALNNLGNVYRGQGRSEEAIACFQQSLEVCREFQDRGGEGGTLNNLGFVYREQGRWEEAIACFQQSLKINREFQDLVGEGNVLWKRGAGRQGGRVRLYAAGVAGVRADTR